MLIAYFWWHIPVVALQPSKHVHRCERATAATEREFVKGSWAGKAGVTYRLYCAQIFLHQRSLQLDAATILALEDTVANSEGSVDFEECGVLY